MLKGEIRSFVLCILLFVVYFRQTKMSICSDPQEGSIVQCLDMAIHEEKADHEVDITDVPLVWLYEVIWVKMAHESQMC